MFELIKELTELYGPVGQEHAVLDYVERLWQDAGAQTERTAIGNVLARAGGSGPSLLLVAHGDELCYLVRDIHPAGFLWLAGGQSWQRQTTIRNWFTIGTRVQVMARSGLIPGVIAAVTGHVANLALREPQEHTWDDFWVETGLTANELRARGVTVGTRVVWDVPTTRLGPHVVGKALDDRIPLAVITEVMRRVPAAERRWTLTLGCTVQEENGLIGAHALAARERFDAAIVVEIGLAGDVPGVDSRVMPLRLGAGPLLVHKDSQIHYDHRLTAELEQVAATANIPIQHAIFGSFGSDGAAFMKSDTPSALVAFAARYTHSPFETGHLGDIEALVDWLCAFVRRSP